MCPYNSSSRRSGTVVCQTKTEVVKRRLESVHRSLLRFLVVRCTTSRLGPVPTQTDSSTTHSLDTGPETLYTCPRSDCFCCFLTGPLPLLPLTVGKFFTLPQSFYFRSGILYGRFYLITRLKVDSHPYWTAGLGPCDRRL